MALPTETVYGLGGRALDAPACAAIFEAKGRPLTDPLIVHLPSPDWMDQIADPCPLARALARAFWPGPLTLVVPRRAGVPDLVTAGQPTVAVRMSAHEVFREVVERLGEPIAAPSANRFGRISPTSAGHVLEELGGRIPLILDGGLCEHGIESTIVRLGDGHIHILRRGPILPETLSAFAPIGSRSDEVVTPGSLKSHYAPCTPLRLVERGGAVAPKKPCGLLAWNTPSQGFDAVRILTPKNCPREAAANLYRALRSLDSCGLDLILAETPPVGGLGQAILERLLKASATPDSENVLAPPQTK